MGILWNWLVGWQSGGNENRLQQEKSLTEPQHSAAFA
jgi:hypothetical protein